MVCDIKTFFVMKFIKCECCVCEQRDGLVSVEYEEQCWAVGWSWRRAEEVWAEKLSLETGKKITKERLWIYKRRLRWKLWFGHSQPKDMQKLGLLAELRQGEAAWMQEPRGEYVRSTRNKCRGRPGMKMSLTGWNKTDFWGVDGWVGAQCAVLPSRGGK